ncbi:MAG: HNH endonuclease signature motif containing protein [bacterium]
MFIKTFDDATIEAVWQKGIPVSGWDATKYRKDVCGAPITRAQYGVTNHKEGWEIDHIIPDSQDGSDSLSNLRPLQWENNRSKSDGKLKCVVIS